MSERFRACISVTVVTTSIKLSPATTRSAVEAQVKGIPNIPMSRSFLASLFSKRVANPPRIQHTHQVWMYPGASVSRQPASRGLVEYDGEHVPSPEVLERAFGWLVSKL